MVDTGATSHIIRDIESFKNFDDSFQPDNDFIELADGTKRNWVALKRGDADKISQDHPRRQSFGEAIIKNK